ncbi:hypothetical protein ACIO7M_10735 [Streptomyces toxytricini]|uniref:Uncharacterized protein n=1 Tax=Streptomyces toxytricini TaxID=67369 RepID=A0ABW8EEB9_STRT5
MLLHKVNQNASLTGPLSQGTLELAVSPVMATPAAIFTPCAGKAAVLVTAAAVGYATAKVK